MKEREKMVLEKCICGDCPSYFDCSKEGGKEEFGFCYHTIGKSQCITEEKGCICEDCPVYGELDLENLYYCIGGSEKELKKN